jgi:hypothetical protein
MTATTIPRVQRVMATAEANDILRDAWMGGKNRDNPYARWFPPGRDGDAWVLVDMPLNWIRPNEAGDRYDGTVNPERACAYAKAPSIETPVYLLFGARLVRFGRTEAAVMDGGHRTSAARMRGDPSLPAIMRQQDFDLLVEVRVQMDHTRHIEQPASTTSADECSHDIL